MQDTAGLGSLGVMDDGTRILVNVVVEGFTTGLPAPAKQDCGSVVLLSYSLGRMLLGTTDWPFQPSGPETAMDRAEAMMAKAAGPGAKRYVSEFGNAGKLVIDMQVAAAAEREPAASLPAEFREKLIAGCATGGLMVAVVEHDLYGPAV